MLKEKILNELNSINSNVFEFILTPQSDWTAKGITTYETIIKQNDFFESGVLNYSDKYFSHIVNVFSKNKLKVNFNNTGRVFWASF